MNCLKFHQNTQDYASKLLNHRWILWWLTQSGLLLTVDYKAALLAWRGPAIAGPFAPSFPPILHWNVDCKVPILTSVPIPPFNDSWYDGFNSCSAIESTILHACIEHTPLLVTKDPFRMEAYMSFCTRERLSYYVHLLTKWHIQWHTTRLATHHKMSNTCNNNASITVNTRPLKKPWQCPLNASYESVVSCLASTTVHWSVQLGYKWLSLTVYQNINQKTCAVSGRLCCYTYMIGFCSFMHDRHVEDSTPTKQWWIPQSHTKYVICIVSFWKLLLIPICLRLKGHFWSTRTKRSVYYMYLRFSDQSDVVIALSCPNYFNSLLFHGEGGRRLELGHPSRQWTFDHWPIQHKAWMS